MAQVDDKVRLQSVDTWFDPLEMFRQIAPHGVVNKETMNRNVDKADALDPVVPDMDGLKIAEQHNNPNSEHAKEPAPAEVLDKHISNGTGKPADAFVPHQGADTSKTPAAESDAPAPAQPVVEAAATQGADAELSHPQSNLHSVSSTPKQPITETDNSIYSSAVTGNKEDILKTAGDPNFVDEQRKYGTYDAVDEHLESSSKEVHPHPHTVEDKVQPGPGEAVVAPATSEETRLTHEEMSSLGASAGQCPFLMNRE